MDRTAAGKHGRDQTPTADGAGVRAALVGLAVGFVVCAIVSGANALSQGKPLAQAWPDVVLTSLVAGAVLAIGGAIAGRYLGAIVGAVLGIAPAIVVATTFLPQAQRLSVTDEPVPSGEPFALAGPTLQGGPLDVKDYRGKVVLVDFWATWCLPCVGELPHVQAAYDKYHDRGFEVVAVSLDDSRQELTAFVRDRQLPWPQVFFDEEGKRGWANPLAKEHGVEGIPATFLLDREGRVIARDLRGAMLEQVVERALEQDGRAFRVQPRDAALFLTLGSGATIGALAGAWLQRRMRASAAG
ncbi:MAG: redoxin domain-containing protein [Gemmataceae bacterium]